MFPEHRIPVTPDEELEMPDNTLEVNLINSNVINPNDYTKYDVEEADIPFKPRIELIRGETTSTSNRSKPKIQKLLRRYA